MTSPRLLLIGTFAPGHLATSYARAFERRGADVFRFDSDAAYLASSRFAHNPYYRRLFRRRLWDTLNRATLAVARTVRPHAILVFKGAYLDAGTVHTLRRELSIPVANYYPDNPFCGVPLNPRKTSAQRRDLLEVLTAYSRVWIWHAALAERLRAQHVAAAYLPFGVDDDVYRPGDGDASPSCGECDGAHQVVLVGQHSDKREAHVGAIARHRVALWGRRWGRAAARVAQRHAVHHAPAFGAAAAALYRAAAVSLNVVDDLNMPGHNMRTFEIPASGGVMIATYTAEQAAFFPDGEAALYYRAPGELDDLIERVLADRPWAARLQEQAQSIARDHAYPRRAAAMLAELGLPGA